MGRSRHPASFAAALLVLITGIGGSCSKEHIEPTPEPAELAAPELRLLVVTDLDGYLEPCGCTSRPLGGIDRMAARLEALRGEGVPTLLVMAGNLFFHGAPHGGDAARSADQELMRAQTVRDVINGFDAAALTPGPLDFAYGVDRFVELARSTEAPLLAAGVEIAAADGAEEDGAEPSVFRAATIVTVGELRVAIVGVTELEGDALLPERVVVSDVLGAARAAIADADADIVVALVDGDRRFARRVARLDGVDFVMHGGLDEADAHTPATTGGAVILHAGRQGQGVVVADLLRGEGGWTDVSEWTREAERAHVQDRVRSLERRIAAWEADESTSASDLAAQRQRLVGLREELRGLEHPPAVEGGYFRARYEELPPEAPQDPAVTRMMSELARRVNEHNRVIFADWAPEPAPEGTAHYVGAERCATCHEAAATWWRAHAHGRAYATLEERDKNFNLSCVGCHVTGYLRPGGTTVTHVENLQDVGCESCHGPGSAHVANPSRANTRRAPQQSTCRSCHTPEHSDTFEYGVFRQRLIAPGHGAPSDDAPSDGAPPE